MDSTLLFKHNENGKITILIAYVDDIILTEEALNEMEKLKSTLAQEFKIKDLGNLMFFLGMGIVRSKKGISISQRKYTLDLLE